MAKYFYVGGSESMCGGTALKTFGQQIDLTPEQAEAAQRGGCVLLDADAFNAIGFTSDELKKFSTAGYQINAPQSFLDKRQTAWNKFGEVYAKLHEPETTPVNLPVVPSVEMQAPVVPPQEPPVATHESEPDEHHEG